MSVGVGLRNDGWAGPWMGEVAWPWLHGCMAADEGQHPC